MDYIMETSHLEKSYKGKKVVDDVNVHVRKGEIYGFVGPNGAGKSTVMKMLLSLVEPDCGEAHIFGKKISEHSYECFKRIGSIIESPCFYEKLTGHENLALHCEYMGFHNTERIGQVLELVELTEIEGKKVSHYSMGMKQRLAIARAILTHPEFLILDEPINALDPEGIRKMRELFRRINQEEGTSIFISSHILSEVEQIADTIGILQKGKLLKEISMSEIRRAQSDYIYLETDNVKKAGYLLEHLAGIRSLRICSDTVMEIYDLSKTVKEISALLVQNDVGIIGIGTKQNSLEDYFFRILEED